MKLFKLFGLSEMTGPLQRLGVVVPTVIRKFLEFIDPQSFWSASPTITLFLAIPVSVRQIFLWQGLLFTPSGSSDQEMEEVPSVKVTMGGGERHEIHIRAERK